MLLNVNLFFTSISNIKSIGLEVGSYCLCHSLSFKQYGSALCHFDFVFMFWTLTPLSHWDVTVCDSLRLTIASESQSGLETVAVIRNFVACVAKSCKQFVKILNIFKNFMRQNSYPNSRSVIAGVSNPSRFCHRPFAI